MVYYGNRNSRLFTSLTCSNLFFVCLFVWFFVLFFSDSLSYLYDRKLDSDIHMVSFAHALIDE